MKRILYIVPHRFNRSPGQRFRCEQYIPILKECGYEITYSNLLSKWDDTYFYQEGKYLFKAFIFLKTFIHRCFDVLRAKRYDAIFIYREAFMIGTTIFERGLKHSGKPIIYDFDDSIWIQDISEGNKNLSWMKRAGKTDEIIAMADLVIVGNQYLAEHAQQFNSNVAIIPTTIDTNYHKPAEKNNKSSVCVGWTGSETTMRHFKLIIPVFERLQQKYGDKISFIQISNQPVYCPNLNLETLVWNAQDEIEQLQKIDIGVMPLPNDAWSKGKCGFKGLQYMSLAIPTIMSPVGVNTEIIADGENGFFATSEDEWFTTICNLIENKELCKTIGKAGRKTVIERYSIDSQKDKYKKLFNDLLNKDN